MLGFRRKRTNLHEKYDYPGCHYTGAALRSGEVSRSDVKMSTCGVPMPAVVSYSRPGAR